MTAIRIGVVGVGRLGAQHARILAVMPGARLIGVHDASSERTTAVADQAGVRAFPNLSQLLREVEAVVVAVPTVEHAAVARAALLAGCHVLVEKPFTTTLAEADELIDLAETRELKLSVGHVERFNSALRAAESYLESPRFIESHRLAPFQLRGTDVPVVLDLMIHDIDLVLGLLDSPVASLHAVGIPVLTDSVDIANARIVFEDGAVADITASRVSVERTRKLRVWQPSGYISLDLARGTGEFFRRRPGPTLPTLGPPSLLDVVERVRLAGDEEEPLRLQLESFLRLVDGEASSSVSARSGRAALDVALRIAREIEQYADVAAPHP
ncbi:MAG: Gfo/Idh/MocA family oxidoreductase [Gemmatimonadota bacterium]